MRCDMFHQRRTLHRLRCLFFGALLIVGISLLPASGQQPLPPSALPNPRLFTVTPCGGKTGTSFEVNFSGTDLEEPQALFFSHPGIKAELIGPAAPPMPDPKQPVDPKQKKGQPPMGQPGASKFKVTIAPDTPPGIHDIRLVNKWGISNPRAFVVGDANEVLEKEPNNDVPEAQRVELNTTIHGTISAPIDVDYFVFAGKKGQRIVVSCLASSIDSRLNPGVELYDSAGKRLGENRDYAGTDALLDNTLAADGDYYVRVYEFTHLQGNAEYFYRLSISTAPWIDAIHPSVVEPGKPAKLTIYGRNLPDGKLDPASVVDGRVLEKITVTVNVPNDPQTLTRLAYTGHLSPMTSGLDGFEYRLKNASGVSNPFLLTYARAPVVVDNEANDTPETAQEVPVPCEIAGRIEKRRDRDWYTFAAKKGDAYHIELYSDRIGAPTDMAFHLRGPDKQDLGEFDDNPETLSPIKFFTRSNDPPRFRFVAAADGKYQLLVKGQDSDVRAGPRHLYRFSIFPEQPDFRLIVLPAEDRRPDACRLLQGGNEAFTVLVWRYDGFNGGVAVTAEGLPAGVTCPPQTVGPGMKQATLVVSATPAAAQGVFDLKLKGTATIRGQTVIREARPGSVTWPVAAQQNIPTVARLDRTLVYAVREQAPFNLSTTIDKAEVFSGDKATLTLKLARLWPDYKTPLTVAGVDLPLVAANQPTITVNNNQPITIPADKNELTTAVEVKANALPGTYNLVLRGTAQIPYAKDPMAKQKPPAVVIQYSTPVTLTVLPKQVATMTLAAPTITAKLGAESEVVIKVVRLYDYNGEFKLELVLPPNAKGISAGEATILAGKDEGRLVLKVAPDAPPGNLPNFVVRATAMLNGKLPTIHEAKFAVNVVK